VPGLSFALVFLLHSSFPLHGSAQDRIVPDWVFRIGVSADTPYAPLDTAIVVSLLTVWYRGHIAPLSNLPENDFRYWVVEFFVKYNFHDFIVLTVVEIQYFCILFQLHQGFSST
jgi:hypothetical protein